MTDIFEKLCAEFPRESIHWRSQQLTRNGDKAMALAYIDARDVMDRLDIACGPAGWQSEHYGVNGKTACKIGVFVEGVGWVWKSDGAGDTAVEGDKGAMSDAFKRAAVHWGIGRYLYDMPVLWVPCETYDKNGKKYFSKFTVDPWSLVKGYAPKVQKKGGSQNKDWTGPLTKKQLWEKHVEIGDIIKETTNVDDCKAVTQSDEFKAYTAQAEQDWPDLLTGYKNGDQWEEGTRQTYKTHLRDLMQLEGAHG